MANSPQLEISKNDNRIEIEAGSR